MKPITETTNVWWFLNLEDISRHIHKLEHSDTH